MNSAQRADNLRRQQQYKAHHREKVNANARRYIANERFRKPEYYMFHNAKKHAKDGDVPFTITQEDIRIPAVCPVLGIVLRTGIKQRRDSSPSLDRKIPGLGYVPGNVQVISWRANRLKMDCTDPREFRAIADYIERCHA